MKLCNKMICFSCLISGLNSCNGQTNTKQPELKMNIDSVYSHILKDSILVTGWYYVSDTDNGFKRQLDRSDEFYFINPKPIVIKDNFIKIEIYQTDFKGSYPDYTGLSIQLDKAGTESWANATKTAIGKKLCFICDNKLLIAPRVNTQITNGMTALNRKDYNKFEIEQLKKKIEKN